jgi:hypothetical protein
MRSIICLRRGAILISLCLCPLLASADGGHDWGATVWAVFINNPEACSTTPCEEADVFAEDNPARTDVCYFTGGRVQSNGRATFGGSFAEGSNFGCIFSQLGLESAQDTETHFVVQEHGRLRGHYLVDQVTEFVGGCPPNVCVDVHFAIHVPADADADGESVSSVFRFKDGSMVRKASSTLRRVEGGIKAAINTRLNDSKDKY